MTVHFSGECVHLLDEAQGLTLEMVRDWLKRDGYKLQTSDAVGEVWDCAVGLPVILYKNGDELGGAVQRIAENARRAVQAVLRDINPRMRKGPPSKAARDAARPCYWLASWTAIGRIGANLWDSDMMDHFADSPEIVEWFFWPCDAAANKIRWPMDEKGLML